MMSDCNYVKNNRDDVHEILQTQTESIINIDDADIRDLRRTIYCPRKIEEKSATNYYHVTFSDLMSFLNIKNDINSFYVGADPEFINKKRLYLSAKKHSLEKKFHEFIVPISKWINFINSRRDKKKILSKNGLNFISFMKHRVSADVFTYLLELYTTEQLMMLVKNYDLKFITYDSLDFESIYLQCRFSANS